MVYDDTCCSFCKREVLARCCIKMCSMPGLLYLRALEKPESSKRRNRKRRREAGAIAAAEEGREQSPEGGEKGGRRNQGG